MPETTSTPEALIHQFALAAIPIASTMHAETSIAADAEFLNIAKEEYSYHKHFPQVIAKQAYLIAAAMIAEGKTA